MNLYEITGEILQLQEMIETGEDEQTVNDTLEAVMADFEDKADAYGAVIRNLEAQADAYKVEIDRMTTKKKQVENGVARLKDRLLGAMDLVGIEEISGNVFKFRSRNNAESLPTGITLESLPEGIRENYERYKDPELVKKKLLADVKAGIVKDIELVRTRSLILK
jgi:hypothetical protein